MREFCRVARWFLFRPKILGYILEDLGMENVVTYASHLEYFTTMGHIFGHLVIFKSFGIFFSALVYCTNNNLATLKFWRK
jgi:hypothetical protein